MQLLLIITGLNVTYWFHNKCLKLIGKLTKHITFFIGSICIKVTKKFHKIINIMMFNIIITMIFV